MYTLGLFDMVLNGIGVSWRQQLVQGILLVAFGMLIIIFPQLLVALIASVFLLAGAIMIGAGFTARRLRREFYQFRPREFEWF